MAIFAVTVRAKPGQADEAARLLVELEPLLKDAPGFQGRHVLKALDTNTGHDGAAEESTHFIWIERWESPEQQQTNLRSEPFQKWYKSFTPHLLPEHSHLWYEDIAGH